jgi:Pvc16 N-terminal domain
MSSAIRDVGETLIELLRNDPIVTIPPAQIALVSPAEANASGVRLTLFLYSLSPVAEYRNELEIPGSAIDDEPVSLPLNLYYLLTAFSPPQDPTNRSLESHLLLGQAMRVFFDNGCLTGSLLRGDLPRDEELRLSLQPITIEDLTRIWSVFPDTALEPSVSYLVTPARVRSNRTRGGARIVSRQIDSDHAVPISSQNQTT